MRLHILRRRFQLQRQQGRAPFQQNNTHHILTVRRNRYNRQVIIAQSLVRRYLAQQERQRMAQNQAQQNALAVLNAIIQAINGQAIQWPAPQQREVNLVKVAEYDGATDPVSWLEDFEKATTANGLMDP